MSAFIKDHGAEPRSWGQVQMFTEKYLKPVFIARAKGTPRAADDAGKIGVFTPEELPQMAFDHGRILDDYLVWRRLGRRPGPTR